GKAATAALISAALLYGYAYGAPTIVSETASNIGSYLASFFNPAANPAAKVVKNAPDYTYIASKANAESYRIMKEAISYPRPIVNAMDIARNFVNAGRKVSAEQFENLNNLVNNGFKGKEIASKAAYEALTA
ncbi:MAG: hypothetical protein K940chlam6_01091, partial [Chlamydiae bacterium]|nr:hypothetical protein [Chlamydiota bacterium]